MIVVSETQDNIIYCEATQHDLEQAIKVANILKEGNQLLERVETPEGINVLLKAPHKAPERIIEFNEVEHELIVTFFE